MLRRARTMKRRLSSKGAAIALIVGLPAAGVAYGATWGLSGPADQHRHHSPIAGVPLIKKRVPRPEITAHPKPQTSSTAATFRVDDRARDVTFECHLDASPWKACARTVTYASVEPKRHRFYARAVREGRESRITSLRWTVEPPETLANTRGLPFTVTQSGSPPLLYPGAGPSPLSLTLGNPNPDPIRVTGLAVEVTGGPAGCAPSVNVRVEPSPASSANPLVVPGGGTLAVPAAQAPTIELAESGMNQDACQGGSFSLSFSGSAHG